MHRILYFCHDNPSPAGGVLTIYRHVYFLNRSGIPACVVHNQTGFKPGWFSLDVPTIYANGNLTVSPGDWLVFPEDYGRALIELKSLKVRKYLFCQNHYYIFKTLREGERWEQLGIKKVICSSEVIRAFLKELFGYQELPVIHYGFDLQQYHPADKKMQIAYMPRKRPREIEFIKNCFFHFYPQYRNIPWIPIHERSQEEVAGILSESTIFLSMNLYEGFGMPPVEAMLSGCVVVGFHGDGGREYAKEKNGFWCEEGNIIQCARTLGKVVRLFQEEPDKIAAVVKAARETAGRYSLENQEKEVISFWKGELSAE